MSTLVASPGPWIRPWILLRPLSQNNVCEACFSSGLQLSVRTDKITEDMSTSVQPFSFNFFFVLARSPAVASFKPGVFKLRSTLIFILPLLKLGSASLELTLTIFGARLQRIVHSGTFTTFDVGSLYQPQISVFGVSRIQDWAQGSDPLLSSVQPWGRVLFNVLGMFSCL